uniref:Uncharacterized protein n=1 Tax=Meloidogyne enterolobii TaxID=390850 RepID=A0A6V7X5M8_MELEN|nr:unnamed protein product [Meloidogyne enterolobii]
MRKNILISCLLFLMFCLFDVLASPGESSGQGELNPPPKLQIFLQENDEPYIRLLRTNVSVKGHLTLAEINKIKKDNELREELNLLKKEFARKHQENHSNKKRSKDYLGSKQHDEIVKLISQNREKQLVTIGKLKEIRNYFAQRKNQISQQYMSKFDFQHYGTIHNFLKILVFNKDAIFMAHQVQAFKRVGAIIKI